jgi:hypothetical protein
MVFEVTQSLAITMHGFQNILKTRFNVEFLALNKDENKRVFGIKKKKFPNIPAFDDSYSEIIEELELHIYPIEIETDLEGNFLEILNYNKWLKNWELKTDSSHLKFQDSQNAKNIRNNYFETLKDKQKFIENRFKEPFWNLLFFNPPLDKVNNQDLGTSLNWNLMSIGLLNCTGRTELKNTSSEEVVIYFESRQKITEEIIEKLKTKTNLNDVNWEDLKTNLQVGATFNTFEKKVKSKKALFELIIEGEPSYVEETVINFKKADPVEPKEVL